MSYTIRNIDTYPQNGKHQEILVDITDFPICITRGEDTHWYKDENGKSTPTNDRDWYVYVDYYSILSNKGFQVKKFRKPETAIRYAIKQYKMYLQQQLKKVNDFKIEESL